MRIHAAITVAFCLISTCLESHADSDAPTVTSFTVTPEPVNITTGSQSVTVSIHITDDAAGFSFATLDFYNPSLTLVTSKFFAGGSRTSGDALDGNYQFTVNIPAYSQPGNWMLLLMVRDSASNIRFYGPGQTNYPGPSGPGLVVTNNGPVDTEAPALASETVSPSVFDASTQDTTVALTLRITDALAGFDHGVVSFYDPNGDPAAFLNPYFSVPASGNANDGIYQVGTSVPRGSMPGEWTYTIQLFDKIGNMTWITGAGFTISGGGSPADYPSYVAFHGLSGADALVDADPDHDQLPCGLEFLLGTDPNTPTDPAGKFWHERDGTHLHLNLMVVNTLAVAANGGFLEAGGGAQPFRFKGQTQTDPGAGWNDVLPQQVSGNHYRVSLPLGGSRGFIRLLLTQP